MRKLIVFAIVLSLVVLVASEVLLFGQGNTANATTCFRGARKGLVKDSRGWHHYVEFDVNLSAEDGKWHVSGPASPQMWPGYYGTYHKRAGYSWPWKLASPWPASKWVACVY